MVELLLLGCVWREVVAGFAAKEWGGMKSVGRMAWKECIPVDAVPEVSVFELRRVFVMLLRWPNKSPLMVLW